VLNRQHGTLAASGIKADSLTAVFESKVKIRLFTTVYNLLKTLRPPAPVKLRHCGTSHYINQYIVVVVVVVVVAVVVVVIVVGGHFG